MVCAAVELSSTRLPTMKDDAFAEERLRFKVHKAALSLSPEATAAYRQACRICPQSIAKESDPIRFLRQRNNDDNNNDNDNSNVASFEDAARLLARNWGIRLGMFQARAFYPLTVKSLSPAAQGMLFNTWNVAILPRDEHGRPVVLYHIPKDQSNMTEEYKHSRASVQFYLITCLAQEAEEFTLLRYAESLYVNTGRPNAVSEFFEAMPIEMTSYQSVFICPPGASRMLHRTVIPNANILFGEYFSRRQTTHVAANHEKAIMMLGKSGLCANILPTQLGGSLAIEGYYSWLQRKCEFEQVMQKRMIDSSVTRPLSFVSIVDIRICTVNIFPYKKTLPGCRFNEFRRTRPLQRSLIANFIKFRPIQNSFEEERLRFKIIDEAKLLPSDVNQPLLQAIEKCPHLIPQESDPVRFLRKCSSVHDAARILARNWTLRFMIFGEQAFIPMTLGDDGPMTEVDKQFMLGDPSEMTLPPLSILSKDDFGRFVLLYHISSGKSNLSEEYRKIQRRCFFFILTRLAQKAATFSCIRFAETLYTAPAKVPVVGMFFESMPIEMVSLQAVFVHPPGAKRIVEQTTLPNNNFLWGKFCTNLQTVHLVVNRQKALNSLEKCGFGKNIMPIYLGGGSGVEKYYKWIEQFRVFDNRTRFKLSSSSETCATEARTSQSNSSGLKQEAQLETPSDLRSDHLEENSFGNLDSAVRSKFLFSGTDSYQEAFSEERLRFKIYKEIESIPMESKLAYLQAIKLCPALILKESDPIRFLRRKDSCAQSAARLLVCNWSIRLVLFKERAFSPMNFANNGALSESDKRYLKSSSLAILPKEGESRSRNIVSMLKSDNLSTMAEVIMSHYRCLFHLSTVLSKEADSISFLQYYDKIDATTETSGALSSIIEPLPIDLAEFHVLYMVPLEARQMLGENFAGRAARGYGKYLENKLQFHVCSNNEEVITSLQMHVWEKDFVENLYSGNWMFKSFRDWIDCQFQSNHNIKGTEIKKLAGKQPEDLPSDPITANHDLKAASSKDGSCDSTKVHPRSPAKVAKLPAKKRFKITPCDAKINLDMDSMDSHDDVCHVDKKEQYLESRTGSEAEFLTRPGSRLGSEAELLTHESNSGTEEVTLTECDEEPASSAATSGLSVLEAKRIRLEERKARKRRSDLFKARDRRKRERVEEEAMNQQYAALKIKNYQLHTEEKHLQNLLKHAVEIVEVHVLSSLNPGKRNSALRMPLDHARSLLLEHKNLAATNTQANLGFGTSLNQDHRSREIDLTVTNNSTASALANLVMKQGGASLPANANASYEDARRMQLWQQVHEVDRKPSAVMPQVDPREIRKKEQSDMLSFQELNPLQRQRATSHGTCPGAIQGAKLAEIIRIQELNPLQRQRATSHGTCPGAIQGAKLAEIVRMRQVAEQRPEVLARIGNGVPNEAVVKQDYAMHAASFRNQFDSREFARDDYKTSRIMDLHGGRTGFSFDGSRESSLNRQMSTQFGNSTARHGAALPMMGLSPETLRKTELMQNLHGNGVDYNMIAQGVFYPETNEVLPSKTQGISELRESMIRNISRGISTGNTGKGRNVLQGAEGLNPHFGVSMPSAMEQSGVRNSSFSLNCQRQICPTPHNDARNTGNIAQEAAMRVGTRRQNNSFTMEQPQRSARQMMGRSQYVNAAIELSRQHGIPEEVLQSLSDDQLTGLLENLLRKKYTA